MNNFDIIKIVKTDDWQPNITTRDGRRVKLHVFAIQSSHPICGFIEGERGSKSWTSRGCLLMHADQADDLIIVEPKSELWMELPGGAGLYNLLVTPNPKDLLDDDKPHIKITYQGDTPVDVKLVKDE